MSKKTFAGQVKNYMKSHTKRRRMRVVMSVLSAFTALCVFGSLMRPAISMEKYNPLLTAEAENAVFGDLLTAHISAVAENENENTVFYLTTDQVSVVFDEDTVSFNEQDTARINTKKGNTISLHRVLDEDGAEAYWFELAPGESEEFDLTYTSESILIGELDEDGNVVSAGSQTTDVTGTAGGSISTGSGAAGGSTGGSSSAGGSSLTGTITGGTDGENSTVENGTTQDSTTQDGITQDSTAQDGAEGKPEADSKPSDTMGDDAVSGDATGSENGNSGNESTGNENTGNENNGSDENGSSENGSSEENGTSGDTADNSDGADNTDATGDSDTTGDSDAADSNEDADAAGDADTTDEADAVTVAAASIQKNEVVIHFATLSSMDESAAATEDKVSISTPSNGDIDSETTGEDEEESEEEEKDKLVYEDPIEAYIIFYTGTGADMEEARIVAQNAKKEETSALKLTWMTQEEYDALDDSQMIVTDVAAVPEDALSWATVEKEGYEPGTDEQYGIMTLDLDEADYGVDMLADGEASVGVDFGRYITSVNTYKQDADGNWKPAKEFTDGDSVKVDIRYHLAANVVGVENRTIYYHLPQGVTPNTTLDGVVYNGGIPVGTYLISDEGLITITFTQQFADSEAFTGDIWFEGMVSSSGSSEDTTVNFGGSGGAITIKPQPAEYDLTIQKAGTLSNDNKQITYTITASTTKGTEDTVTISDTFEEGNATYVANSFIIEKVGADGRTPVTGFSPVLSNTDSGKNRFTIDNLPKLEKNEQYVVTYTADVNDSTKVNNKAYGASGQNHHEAWHYETIPTFSFVKTGSYNATTKEIEWKIEISNPTGMDLTGYKLSDTLKDANGNTINLPDKVTLTQHGTWTNTEIELPYTFPENSTASYTVTYTTPAGEDLQNQTVSNKAELKPGDGSGKPSYDSDTDVNVPDRVYDLTKSSNGMTITDKEAIIQWKSAIQVPYSVDNLANLTYTDTLDDAVSYLDSSQVIEDSHYVTPEKLLSSLKVTLPDGPVLIRGTDYQVVDAAGAVISNANDSETHLKSFGIEFLDNCKNKIAGSVIQLEYQTILDLTKFTIEDVNYKIVNRASILDHRTSANVDYYSPKPDEFLKKQASASGNHTDFNEGDLTINYDTSGKKLHYRLLLKVNSGYDEDIVISDAIPEGAKADLGSVKAYFYQNDTSESVYNGDKDYPYFLDANGNTSKDTTSNEDKSTTLTITIKNGYNSNPYYHPERTFSIYYDLLINDDTYWNVIQSTSKDYVNTAVWNGHSSEHKTTVNRVVGNIAKTGNQVMDEYGMPTNKVHYEIVINPQGIDLDLNSDTITLEDVLTATVGDDTVEAELLLDSVKLYRGKVQEGELVPETEISKSQYQYTYDADTHTIRAVLPDSMPCILVYDYLIDSGLNSATVNNEASLNGKSADKSEDEVKLEANISGAGVNKQHFTIYKVDSKDYSKLLSGAKFQLEGYCSNEAKDEWSWQPVEYDYTTGEDGKITLYPIPSREESNQGLPTMAYDTLYRLTETEAPGNYVIASTSYYFVWMQHGVSRQDTITKMGTDAFGLPEEEIKTDDVEFISDSGSSVMVPNDYTHLAVKKVWQTQNGGELEDAKKKDVTLNLYRQKQKLDACTVTINVQDMSGNSVASTKTYSTQIAKGSGFTVSMSGGWSGVTFYQDGIPQDENPVITMTGETYDWKYPAIYEDCTITLTNSYWVNASGKFAVTFKDYDKPGYTADGDSELVGQITLNSEGSKFTPESGSGLTETTGKKAWQWESGELLKPVDGSDVYYHVEEVSVPEGFVVTYLNNNGIQTGEIVVTNTSTSFTLPETGGRGTLPHCIIGTLLLLGSAIIMRRRRERFA